MTRRIQAIGARRWAIAEGFLPKQRPYPQSELKSHETVCILNASDADAHVRIMIYFADREPAGPYELTVPARRTKHLRFNDLHDPESIPEETDYSSVLESDVPVVLQHTRLDARESRLALLSTVAFPAPDDP